MATRKKKTKKKTVLKSTGKEKAKRIENREVVGDAEEMTSTVEFDPSRLVEAETELAAKKHSGLHLVWGVAVRKKEQTKQAGIHGLGVLESGDPFTGNLFIVYATQVKVSSGVNETRGALDSDAMVAMRTFCVKSNVSFQAQWFLVVK